VPLPALEKGLARVLAEDDIWRMDKRTLLAHFRSVRSGRPVAKRMIRSLIWQVYERINHAQMDPIGGNIRSFWYRFVKAPLGRVGLLEAKADHYVTMMQVFAEMVQDLDLFQYTAFGFDDPTWENRRIGKANPTAIVFAEKNGFMRFLKEQVHATFDVSVVALSGWPSILSTEYMARHIEESAGLDPRSAVWSKKARLFSIVDWDPSGWMIRETFVRQLEDQGMKRYTMSDLIHPDHFTAEEIELYRYPLPKGAGQKKKNQRWLEATGGVAGELYGLEADSLPRPKLTQVLAKNLARLA
jgi:hypothetical protein